MGAAAGPSPFEGLLAEAGRHLAASLDLDDTLRTVARLAVPEFADWAAVDLVEPDGAVRGVSSGHGDPAVDAFLLELRRRHRAVAPAGGDPPAGALQVLATGEPAVFPALAAGALPEASEDERARWTRLRPVSWLIVPLVAAGRVVGALTFLGVHPRRAYDDGDFPVALELAERCGQAIRNAQLYDEARSGRALLDTLFAAAPVAMTLLDGDLRPVLRNTRMEELAFTPDPALAGRVLAGGEAVRDAEVRDGDRTFLASYAPVAADGRVLGVACAAVETTAHHRLLDRTARLQGVTEQLSAALTEAEVARVILRAGVAAAGARCAVLGLVGDDHELVVRHREGLPGDAPGRLALDADAPMPAAARSGEPVLLASRAAWLERFPRVPPQSAFEAFAAVPLCFDDEVVGVMGVGFPQAGAPPADDVDLLVAIARLGAQALERARLYEERAYVARTLQAGLLPRALPGIDGFELAVRYRPIGDGSEVGGDFYDVVPLDDGSLLVAVGDICGKGTAAAVLTGVMRSTIRALALHETDARGLVDGVNEALLREGAPLALASMACATIRRDAGGVEVRVAAGGHPPALVLRRGGDVDEVAARGPLLGVQHEPALVTATAHLDPGELLLLYTDGVIDARRAGSAPFGEARLHEALAAGAGRDAQGALDVIDAALRAYAPGPPRDDKALLAVRPS